MFFTVFCIIVTLSVKTDNLILLHISVFGTEEEVNSMYCGSDIFH